MQRKDNVERSIEMPAILRRNEPDVGPDGRIQGLGGVIGWRHEIEPRGRLGSTPIIGLPRWG